ncbi:sugar ABC transporter substrate-binding protein [Butyricicoccus faecihominis]|uniref:sugar ABC transporter substrate-binding protein n=1 Tax=Butyricicoccus faecihominis TaxID=1712515 RepID=UPI002479D488|nr:sugar ABC transporter substrate-binding protein [Butyricicoccus faecihominis]MCQ5128261.1 sugar ABC transporter substrate-binding protein [Butyricicoccus faecihominis]
MTSITKRFLSVILASTLGLCLFTGCSGEHAKKTALPADEDVGSNAATAPDPAADTLDLASIYDNISSEMTYVDLSSLKLEKAATEYTIGLAMVSVSSDWFRQLADDLTAELEDAGCKVLMVECDSDATKQVSQIENFITQGVDAIIVNPADPQAAINIALNKAYDADIPVISVDLPPDDGAKYMTACITDAYSLGYAVGEELATRLLEMYPEGEIEYGLIGGTDGNYIASNRNKGERDAIQAVDKEGRIVESAFLYAGAYTEEAGLKTAENMLVAHPNLKAIIGTCGGHAVGATAAAKRQGVDQNLIMGCVDGSKAELNIMKENGPIQAVGLNSPTEVAQMAARTIISALNGTSYPASRQIAPEPTLVTPNNIDNYYNPDSAF